MKFLLIWSWAPKNAKKVTERFRAWKGKGKYTTLYPTSTMIGMNKGFQIIECDDSVELQKDASQWTDLMSFKIIPIMDSRESVALSQ
jgi:hypothetical protein